MEQEKNKSTLWLKIAACVALVATIVYIIGVFVFYEKAPRLFVSNFLFAIPIVIADFIIVISYIKQNKNVTKSMIGFILCGLLMLSIHYSFSYFDITQWYYIVKAILFVMIAIFTINQFLLSNDHFSRPIVLFINQQIMVLLTILSIVSSIINCVSSNENPITFISLLVFVLATMFIILEIEMKVNAKKVQREEKGYVFVQTEPNEEVLEKEDMFISNGYFNSLPWIVIVGLVLSIVFNAVFDKAITWGYSIRYLFFVIKIICLFIAIISYKRKRTDVLKIMLGFLLGTLLFENLCEVTFISTDSVSTIKSIATIAMIAANVFFIFVHLLLTQSNYKNEKIVKLMKVTYVIYVTLTVAVAVCCSVYYLIGKGNNYGWFMVKPVMWLLETFPVITGIVTIDTRVNGYKLQK